MKKIPTIFKRNPNNMNRLSNQPHPDCEWVFNGQGVATRKYDGTCCLVQNGILFKRREVKKGKAIPDKFIEADYDEVTGKRVGWMPCSVDDNSDAYHFEAFRGISYLDDGTYELVGPKIQGNPEGKEIHTLIPHSQAEQYLDAPTDFVALAEWLTHKDIEGLVWHHPDGRMAKIKKRDFGLNR